MNLLQARITTGLRVLHALIQSHPLGTWATQDAGGILVNHVPFLLDPTRGPCGTLRGHVARANSVWQTVSPTVPSVIVFQGPDSYISPSWYPGKHTHGKAVPTWNYAVVHVHGMPVIVQDEAWLLDHISQLTDTHESGQALPWKVTDAPIDFINQMVEQMVEHAALPKPD